MTSLYRFTMPGVNEINLKVNVTYGDAMLNDEASPETAVTLFVFWGIILPLIATVGLIGNILTIIVLWRKEMSSTTILYLRGLVVTDTGILVGSVLALTPISCANYLRGDALLYFKDTVYPVLHTPAYYIVMTLQQCNVWITVSVSMERYIAICHPFRAARLISRRKTIIVMVIIAVVSLLYNIPHLFASEATPCTSQLAASRPADGSFHQGTGAPSVATSGQASITSIPSPLASSSSLSSSPGRRACLMVGTTYFGNTDVYKIYRTVMYTIVIYVIPFAALLILNSFLIKELMTMQRRRSGTNIHEENEANLSLVLVLIVIVFIFCQTPGLISQFDVISIDDFFGWLAVSNLLFAINSAVNFLIYTAFGRKFRKVLLRIFRHVFNKNRSLSQSSYRNTQYTVNDLELSDGSGNHCTAMRSFKCYKKEMKASEKLPESLPLHHVTVNQTAVKHNGSHAGNKRALSPTPEHDSEYHATDSLDNMETSPLTSGVKDADVTYNSHDNVLPDTPRHIGLSTASDAASAQYSQAETKTFLNEMANGQPKSVTFSHPESNHQTEQDVSDKS